MRLMKSFWCVCVMLFELASCSEGDDSGPAPKEICQASCEQDAVCLSEPVDVDECIRDCVRAAEDAREDISAACFDAQTTRLACVSELSCTAREAWFAGDPDGTRAYPCRVEDRQRNAACVDDICDCSYVVSDCIVTYDAAGNGTPDCTCSPACCC